MIATTENGYATAEAPAEQVDIGTLKIQAYATVRGKFTDGGKPVAGATVIVNVVWHDAPGRLRLQDNLRYEPWASWCGPCKRQLPELKALHAKFAGPDVTTLSLSLDDDLAAWQKAVKELGLPWSQGRVGTGGAAGVSSVPAYWLLDPTGKLVAKGYGPDELVAAIEARKK